MNSLDEQVDVSIPHSVRSIRPINFDFNPIMASKKEWKHIQNHHKASMITTISDNLLWEQDTEASDFYRKSKSRNLHKKTASKVNNSVEVLNIDLDITYSEVLKEDHKIPSSTFRKQGIDKRFVSPQTARNCEAKSRQRRSAYSTWKMINKLSKVFHH